MGVLDLGSTSFHMLVAELDAGGEVKRVARMREMLRLGAELAQSLRFSPPVFQGALESAARLRAFAQRHEAERLVAIGTAALREAENGPQLSDAIASVLGVPVRIISGREEARIIFGAIRQRLELGSEATLGLDLGGGSLEFALGNARDVTWASSLPLGVARLQGELVKPDRAGRIPRRQLEEVQRRTSALVAPLRGRIAAARPARAVAVGGTVRALARLSGAGRLADAARGFEISADVLNQLAVELARLSHDERLERRGMNPRRADLLPVGAAILASTLAALDLSGLVCCDWGLREGVALQILDRGRTRRGVGRRRGTLA